MNPVWKIPWSRPVPITEQELSKIDCSIGYVVFQLEMNSFLKQNPTYIYKCYSCYAASGDREYSFETESATPEKLKDGPTENQREEMSNHAKQHTIMYQWARSIK